MPDSLRTETFRRDHEDLLAVAGRLIGDARVDLLVDEAPRVRVQLARFAGMLQVHTALEERVLYPRLFAQPDLHVRTRAHELHESFATLHADFLAFAAFWMEEDALECEPLRYVVEVRDVMRRIAARVALETEVLYPLVEAVGG